eukprot:CAMPEP_0118953716 /NCGR_PEP_ID=MMETSP1169-20130426/57058_1 /TAXON_ID=36882 /ORGANISM="Pyramimonas obovata, Strain CCMP722" /LENGTH=101 /DNA_ID=CAMNT_0006901239 /DNA_START=117 /DNA_END=419 /DNA_ORIENTATION=+
MYGAIVIPYRLGFEHDAKGSMRVLEIVIDLIFGVDIVFNFRTAYQDDGEIVTDSRLMARRYLRGWFFLDFISTAPIYDVVKAGGANSGGLRTLKLLRVLRL